MSEDNLFANMVYDQKTDDLQVDVDQACKVLRAVMSHLQEGGSYRTFIYDRLGLPMSAYGPMMSAGGMEFSNLCPYPQPASGEPRIIDLKIAKIEEIHSDGALVKLEGMEDLKRWDDDSRKPKVGDPAVAYWVVTSEYSIQTVKSALEHLSWSALDYGNNIC